MKFSSAVQTGPGAAQTLIQWVPGLSFWRKRPERGDNYTPPASGEVKDRVELYF